MVKYILCLLFIISVGKKIDAQSNNEDLQSRIEVQQSEIQDLRNQINTDLHKRDKKIDNYAPLGMVLFLFGAFCALWAQNTRRNAWLWFFLGLFFNVIAALFVLVKNNDRL